MAPQSSLLNINTMKYCTKRFCLIERFRKAKFIAVIVFLSLSFQIFYPVRGWALTAGPSSPDFASFEPVATTNMVNDFTGQFVYNIPVLEVPGENGGGYAMSLSYHSGDGPESEASWVGAGWTLNPGSINRMKRGIPDDFNKKSIKYYNEMPKIWTVSATSFHALEAYSVVGSSNNTVRYNNYKGFSFNKSLGLQLMSGFISLGLNYSAGDGTYSAAINPGALLSFAANEVLKMGAKTQVGKEFIKLDKLGLGQQMINEAIKVGADKIVGSHYQSFSYQEMTAPQHITPYEGLNISGSLGLTINPGPIQVGLNTGINISYTSQKNIPEVDVDAVGYMYAGTSSDGIQDYNVENESTYNPRDLYLPVPTSSPDAFFVSGEGLGGTFRLHNDRIGVFSPNQVSSKTSLNYFGVSGHVGWTFGAGFETNVDGEHSLSVNPSWDIGNGNTDTFSYAYYGSGDTNTHEVTFFRFNNDLGGEVKYTDDDRLIQTYSNKKGPFINTTNRIRQGKKVPDARRSGRSSYIGYHTNGEMRATSATGKKWAAYEKNPRIDSLAGRRVGYNTTIDDIIGEVSVYNEDGNNYVYGLPVYNAREKQMMQGIEPKQNKHYFVTTNVNNKKVGEEYSTPYPTSYLLTQITSPDFVDLDMNGPDSGDFGGYTRFMYKPVHWMQEKTGDPRDPLYKWRVPYNGVYYNHMRFADRKDDMGAYQSGYKEVYVLDTIETKTHFAVFITGTRLDSWSANIDDDQATTGAGIDTMTQKPMLKLKEIRLYAKNANNFKSAKLIKTVHFQYDYTTWPGVYNNNGGVFPNTGKLTLRRVWFEYNGVVNANVSPYEFDYNYPTVTYPAKYQNIYDEMNGSLNQAPAYTPFSDCWGNYQDSGEYRRNKILCGPTQVPKSSFDPAAWQLKRIILPSGGEIHIQYEQNSYDYVQNRSACAMVSLIGDPQDLADGTRFYLNLGELNISSGDKQKLANRIKRESAEGRQMYFKFFYSILDNDSSNFESCDGEYIDGFAQVVDAGVDGSNVYVDFASKVPRKNCIDYAQKELGGNLFSGDCKLPSNAPRDPAIGGGSLENITDNLKQLGRTFIAAVQNELAANIVACKALNPRLSYLRIPVWNKKGGGVRVKRLMMYDNGIEASTKALYGTEYVYENEETGESYGVATNEPIENSDENPLVDYLKKREPLSTKERKHQGRDVDQFRGPTSMNALPAASVGYSKVIKRNIHQDKYTGTGYSVAEYYTVKDYPFDMYYKYLGQTGVSISPIDLQKEVPTPKLGFFKYTMKGYYNFCQSYLFIQNQMHGQLKSTTDYAGEFNNSYYSTVSPPSPVAQKRYTYFEPGEAVPMFNFKYYNTYDDFPGKMTDITIDRRSVVDESSTTRVTGDLTYAQLGPISLVFSVAFPVTSSSHVVFNSLATNKTIQYPAILKRTEIMEDGTYQVVDNVGFDPLTGKPVVTRTYDGYNKLKLWARPDSLHQGAYTQYNIPASSQYAEMGQKAWNERYAYHGTFPLTGSGPSYIAGGVNRNNIFSVGDLVALHGGGTIKLAYVVANNGSDLELERAGQFNSSIPTGASTYIRMEVVRSGHTNQLNASSGGFLEYGGTPNNTNIVRKPSLYLLPVELRDSLLRLMQYSGLDTDSTIVSLRKYKGHAVHTDGWYPEVCSDPPVAYIKMYKFWNTSTLKYNHDIQVFDSNNQRMLMGGLAYWPAVTPFTTQVDSMDPGIPWPHGFVFKKINSWQGPYFHIVAKGVTIDPWGEAYPMQLCKNDADYDINNVTEGVLKASLTTYANSWPYDTMVFERPPNLSEYEQGIKGKWRPYENYVLRDSAYPGSDPSQGQRTYRMAGISLNFEKVYPWLAEPQTFEDLWVKTGTVSNVMPHGMVTQEMDAHETFSTAKFGYFGALPIIIAKNAIYDAVAFESFEVMYKTVGLYTTLENNLSVWSATLINDAHTGSWGYLMMPSDGTDPMRKLTFNDVRDVRDNRGHVIRFWAKVSEADVSAFIGSGIHVKVTPQGGSATSLTVKYVGRSGRNNWALFEAEYPGPNLVRKMKYEIYKSSEGNVVLDDVRIESRQAKSTAYVYDVNTFKLLAVFGEDHFPVINQYDGEGKLVRKLRETFHGSRTIAEFQNHMPKRLSRADIADYKY